MPNTPCFTTIELKTQYLHSQNFYGCCGSVVWYLDNRNRNSEVLLKDLKIAATTYMNSKSIAVIIVKEDQKNEHLKTLTDFGFVEIFGPIPNVNTRNNLYGFHLDLNKYREKVLAELV